MKKNTQATSFLFIFIAASLWGTTGMANRSLVAAGVSQIQMTFVRVLLAALILGLFLLVFDRKAFKIKLKDVWVFIGSGVVSLTFFCLCYFSAMQEMSLSMAATLLYMSPVFVILISAVCFKERITLQKICALVLVIGGTLLTTGVLSGNVTVSVVGLLYGLGSAVGYALYSIFSRVAFNKGYSPSTVTFYTFAFATLATVFFADFPTLIPLSANASTFGWELYMGVATALLPYVFYTKGLQNIENGQASIIATWELIMATIMSVAVFQETFTIANACGIACVVGGIVLINVKLKKKPLNENPFDKN